MEPRPETHQVVQVITGTDGITRERIVTMPILPAPAKPLRPIEGPSAFGRDRGRFFGLLWLTALQSYRLQYRSTVLGYLWTVLRPLAYFAVLYVVFTQIVRFGDEIPNYAALLLLNIMLFQFFADATGTAMGSVVRQESVVRKLHFPRIVIPLAVVLSSCMTSGMNLIVVLGFILAVGIPPSVSWLLLPLVALAMVVVAAGTSLLLSIIYVRVRDIENVWTVAMRVLFYATPILYPLEFVPESFRWIVALNPLSGIMYQARAWLVQPGLAPLHEVVGVLPVVGSVLIAITVCALGVVSFVRRAPGVAEAI